MNLAQRIEKAMKLVVVPENRHAKLWLNREGAEEIWDLLELLHKKELDGAGDGEEKMWAWKYEEPRVDSVVIAHGQPITLTVPEPEEKSPTTALDRDGEYIIPWVDEVVTEFSEAGEHPTSQRPGPGWYCYPLSNLYVSCNPVSHGHPGTMWGPLPEERVMAILSSNPQATEAQEPETQEATF